MTEPLSARSHPGQRGVSLVEALMALAVMAFGMLALVGVQTTLRLNNDLSKQRSEATRIATEEIEGMRVFTIVSPQVGQSDWSSLASRTIDYTPPDAGIGNTSYQIVRTVTPVAGTQQRAVRVQVQWTDRTGAPQVVTMDSTIVGVAPVLAAMLSVDPLASATNQIDGRDPTIPQQAVSIGDHRRSAFKPFDRGTVVWLFDNATGEVVSRCTGVVTAAIDITQSIIDAASCTPTHGRRLAGTVRFDLGASPSPAQPQGPSLPLNASTPLVFAVSSTSPVSQASAAECVADANQPTKNHASETGSSGDAQTWTRLYECVVFPADATGWGGKLNVVLAATFPDGGSLPTMRGTPGFRACRYTTAAFDYTANADHPLSYCVEKASPAPTAAVPCNGNKVTRNLIHQNFLVIAADASCPPDDTANTPLVNDNTRLHQSPL